MAGARHFVMKNLSVVIRHKSSIARESLLNSDDAVLALVRSSRARRCFLALSCRREAARGRRPFAVGGHFA